MTAPTIDRGAHEDDLRAEPRQRGRSTAAALVAAALIAGGAYAAMHGSDPESGTSQGARLTPAASEVVVPRPRAMREMQKTIQALYGPRPHRRQAPDPRT